MTLDLTRRRDKGAPLSSNDYDSSLDVLEEVVEEAKEKADNAAPFDHTHANLIFVDAGVDDATLAAAFALANISGRRIVLAAPTTVKVPSVAPTIQAACTLVEPTVDVTVLIESGHTIDNTNQLRNGDYSRFRLTSEDSEVLVGTNLPGEFQGVVKCYNAKAPVWDFLLDCDGKSGTGLALFQRSDSIINTTKGIKRARRANAFATEASNLACLSANGTGAILSDGLETGV